MKGRSKEKTFPDLAWNLAPESGERIIVVHRMLERLGLRRAVIDRLEQPRRATRWQVVAHLAVALVARFIE